MREVPTIGFNSAKYDCNIMKKYLYETLKNIMIQMKKIKKMDLFKF